MRDDRIAEYVALLGREVVVTIERGVWADKAVVAKGTLLAYDDGGSAVVRDEMGFVHYCWPMLEITPLHNDGRACE